MQELETMLSQSIQQYECIRDFLRNMDEEVGNADPVTLQNFSDSLHELQAEAMQIDQVLLAQLNKKTKKNEPIQNLIARRELLQQEILLLNTRITEKVSRVKSLIAHEMKKLSKGLSALSGYKQQQHNQGRIVNGTS